MIQMVSYEDWLNQYTSELMRVGVIHADAQMAAQLGWAIVQTHQACYGIDSAVPVNFSATAPQPGLRAVAACRGSRVNRSEESYFVFAGGIARILHGYRASLSDSLELQTVLEGIAVHEVRHRVQQRESASFTSFRRAHLSGFWTDPLAALVCAGMAGEFNELSRQDADRGVPREDLDWMYSDAEFDAAVVERLYLHQWQTLENDRQLARFVRMSCPRIAR